MANLNIRSKQERTYQAIVIGSGISGAWAAKELCDLGVKTLMLERGKNVEQSRTTRPQTYFHTSLSTGVRCLRKSRMKIRL
jgi:choline dehydrogenase-like flavoprotein